MPEQPKSLTDELTGNGSIQTDHGGLDIGDLIVLLFDAVLLIYTAWRSYDFLTTTVPAGWQFLALIGLWGLDIGAVGWSLVWIFGSTTKYQDWTAITFFVVDLSGVVLTSLTDSLMYSKEGAMSDALSGIAMVIIPLVIVANVIAGFIYHMASPATKARRANRKADAEHNRKMGDLTQMERDLTYAEQYLLARQEQLEKSQLLANIKTQQDVLEKSVRGQLNDRIGVQAAASAAAAEPGASEGALAELKKRIEALKTSMSGTAGQPASSLISDPGVKDEIPVLVPAGPSAEAVKGNGHAHSDPS
jgi:hypothetical protein